MTTKDITFTYSGGTQQVEFNIIGTSLPITYISDNSDWISVNIKGTVADISVIPTYDYRSRECKVRFINASGNELQTNITQSGYEGIGIRCDKSIVLSHSYFDMNKFYGFYVTIYGGNTQELKCSKLSNNIKKVWDNSDMYNDFVIQITKDIEGIFTIKHSEYDNYKKYCKKNKIEFDESKVLRQISITQISADDTVGELRISVDGIEYTNKDTVNVFITSDKDTDIEIISSAYTKQLSSTKYTIVDDKDVDYPSTPSWIIISKENNIIHIKASGQNRFSRRTFKLPIVNHTNSHQFMNLNIIQDTGI